MRNPERITEDWIPTFVGMTENRRNHMYITTIKDGEFLLRTKLLCILQRNYQVRICGFFTVATRCGCSSDAKTARNLQGPEGKGASFLFI